MLTLALPSIHAPYKYCTSEENSAASIVDPGGPSQLIHFIRLFDYFTIKVATIDPF